MEISSRGLITACTKPLPELTLSALNDVFESYANQKVGPLCGTIIQPQFPTHTHTQQNTHTREREKEKEKDVHKRWHRVTGGSWGAFALEVLSSSSLAQVIGEQRERDELQRLWYVSRDDGLQ